MIGYNRARVGGLKKSNKEKTVLQYLMKKKGCTFGTAASKVDKSDYEKRCPSGANNEEPKPDTEPEQATDDPGPEPEEEIVDPEEDPEEDPGPEPEEEVVDPAP